MARAKCDFFISYAHHDKKWVAEQLYSQLTGCEYSPGHQPLVFLDGVGENDNIPHGAEWKENLRARIESCTVFIPVFSQAYFESKYCLWELQLIQPRLTLEEAIILPLEIDPNYKVLPQYRQWQARKPHTDKGWLEGLFKTLKVTRRKTKETLQFDGPIPPATAGLTLAPVRVRVRAGGATAPPVEVTLTSIGCTLGGDATARTAADGEAVFNNLLLSPAATGVRLTARVPGLDDATSAPFDVRPAPAAPTPPTPPTIPVEGEAVFFASGNAVLVMRPGAVGVYNLAGKPLLPGAGEIAFPGRVRLVRRSGSFLALADWTGNVFLFDDTGSHKAWSFDQGGVVVPGDLAFDGADLYVGFWSGLVSRMSLTTAPKQVLYHAAGIQALAVANGQYYLSDFDGKVAAYTDAPRLVNTAVVEPSVWLLRATPQGLLAVGDTTAYQIQTRGFEVLQEELPLPGMTAVLADTACPVLMNDRGQGVRVTTLLTFRQRIHAAPGAVPFGADDAGKYCVLANADGSRTLLHDERVIFNHAGGTLAVAAAGDRFAVGEPGGVRIQTVAAFLQRLAGPTT